MDFLNSPAGVATIIGLFLVICTLIVVTCHNGPLRDIAQALRENRTARRSDGGMADEGPEGPRLATHDEVNQVWGRMGEIAQDVDATGGDVWRCGEAISSLARTMGVDPRTLWPEGFETPDTRERPQADDLTAAYPTVEPSSSGQELVPTHPQHTSTSSGTASLADVANWQEPQQLAGVSSEQPVDPGSHTGRMNFGLRGPLQGDGKYQPMKLFNPEDFSPEGRKKLWNYILTRIDPGVMPWMSLPDRVGFSYYDQARALIMHEFGFALYRDIREEFPGLEQSKTYRDWLEGQDQSGEG